MLVLGLIFSGAASCFMIDDADLKAYCKARQSGSESSCAIIRNEGLRITCRVELGADAALCNSISDSQQRAICQSHKSLLKRPT